MVLLFRLLLIDLSIVGLLYGQVAASPLQGELAATAGHVCSWATVACPGCGQSSTERGCGQATDAQAQHGQVAYMRRRVWSAAATKKGVAGHWYVRAGVWRGAADRWSSCQARCCWGIDWKDIGY